MNTTITILGFPNYSNGRVTADFNVEAEQSVTVPAGTFLTTPLNGTDPSGTFNTTYWTGYPDAENPYIAPYPCWEAINLMMHELTPTGAS